MGGWEGKTITNLEAWSEKWGMLFNVDKCKVLHIGRSNPQYKYYMNGIELQKVDEEKDIGVIINKNLKPTRQCTEASRKAKVVLGQISRTFHYRDRKTFLKLYTQYVRPHIEFSISAWSPWNLTDIEDLEKVQIRAVSMVSGLKGRTYDEKLHELGLDSLEYRRKRFDMVQVYKILNGFDKVDSSTWFTTYGLNPTRNTRQSNYRNNLIQTSIPKTDIRKHFFSQRVIQDWNSIPESIKDSRSIKSFKNSYDIFKGANSCRDRSLETADLTDR